MTAIGESLEDKRDSRCTFMIHLNLKKKKGGEYHYHGWRTKNPAQVATIKWDPIHLLLSRLYFCMQKWKQILWLEFSYGGCFPHMDA
jgi:hypothetical protein